MNLVPNTASNPARKSALRLLPLLSLLLSFTAQAAEFLPYTDERFAQLTQDHKLVVLDVHADWCPTCQAQQPVLKEVVSAPPYDAYTVLVVNFDDQADVRKRFKVAQQSTLVVFNGSEERARATGFVDPKSIGILLKKGL